MDRATTDKEMHKAAMHALIVQDACNLCGVAQSFAKIMSTIRENTNGTDEANTHAIAVLFADKIYDLVGRPDGLAYSKAYDEVSEMAKED